MKRNLKQKVWLIIRLYNLVIGYLSVIKKYIFGHQKLKQKKTRLKQTTHTVAKPNFYIIDTLEAIRKSLKWLQQKEKTMV